jgi:PAS domain S-box-containing protein
LENTILSRILSSISQGVLVAGPDHKILFSNRAFLEITEFCESDIIGNTCRIMQGPDTDKATVKAIRAALDAGVEFSGEILNYRKSGETFWNDLTITPHFNDDGSVGHFIGVTRNVTEQKRQQEEYTRSRALAAVGQLTGGIAHDFNNLLMIIQGNAELLEMADLSDHDAESVSLINKAADSAAVLIGRLMSFSRQSPLQTVCVNLRGLIPNTVALLKSGIPPRFSR